MINGYQSVLTQVKFVKDLVIKGYGNILDEALDFAKKAK